MWAHYSAPRRNCAVHARQKPTQKRHRNWGAYYDGKRPVPQSTTIYTIFVFSIFIYTSLTNFELIIKYLNITVFFIVIISMHRNIRARGVPPPPSNVREFAPFPAGLFLFPLLRGTRRVECSRRFVAAAPTVSEQLLSDKTSSSPPAVNFFVFLGLSLR